MDLPQIIIYTDGSCNTQSLTGAWVAIILEGNNRTVIKGIEKNTTHNRMELTAVIKALDFAITNYPDASIIVYTDSQYVVNLPERKEKLMSNQFITKKGNVLNNSDLLQQLISYISKYTINFYKVVAHQKPNGTENLNREVDIICRQLMREASL